MKLDELDVFVIEVATATRQRHLDNLTEAIHQPRSHRSFRRLPLMVAATLLLIPLGAWASASSVPGDLLHPVKRFLEPARALFDDDIRARHRIEELEALIEQQRPQSLIDQQLIDAEDAVGDNPLLVERLEDAKEELARGPVSDEMRPTTTTTTATTMATRASTRP